MNDPKLTDKWSWSNHYNFCLNHSWLGYGWYDSLNQKSMWVLYTSVLVFGCWLMNRVIYIKRRQKQLFLQPEQTNFFFTQNGQV